MKNAHWQIVGSAALGIAATLVSSPVCAEVPAGPAAGPPCSSLDMRKHTCCSDGTYTATGWYGNLPSSITVTLTLKESVITSVQVEPHATEPTSLGLQRDFAAAIPAVVVGKRIDEVRVHKLAGSSGTPRGFNDAVRRIKEQACKLEKVAS